MTAEDELTKQLADFTETIHILINKVESVVEYQDRTNNQFEYLQNGQKILVNNQSTIMDVLDRRLPAQQVPSTSPLKPSTPPTTKSKTPWQTSQRNPAIEYCFEQNANPADVARAKDARYKDIWYLKPQPGYETGTICRRKP